MTDTEKLKSMISGLEGKTMSSRLQPLMPDIDRKIKEGVPRSEIYKLIIEQGINITEGTLYTYLYRYRKKISKADKKDYPEKTQNQKNTKFEQNGNSEKKPESEKLNAEPTLDDMLSNENSREEFTNKFMTNKPILRKKS